ncbi:hypothetical protein Ahy_A07g035305 [Arachis hypogaea]|uniref:Protein FAR1-RELATED SEQUENCE n=1 Tax=Arachis hypogaea TaxID=3818 RepID=A0A445CDL3_ARAHY|nr:hypothetical protein Ahy_A07g035305 [Arachis hypogaea]
MNESTSNQLNECDLDDSSETHQFDEISCVVDEKFVPKVGMIFKTLEEARKFYKHYSKLAELYEDRNIWIPVYLDHCFWAWMRSTQGSESMHSFFNKFITRNNSLRQFVKQYDNCLANREQAEREFDAADFHTMIPCAIKSAIEAQFQHVFTHEKFREVQAQFRGKLNYITRSMHSTLGFITYEVIEQSKNIKRRHTHIKSSQDEPLLEPRSKRFDELVFRSHNICEFASESKELTRILHRAFDKVMAEMEEYQERSKGKSLLTHKEATLSNVNDL